MKRIFCLCLSFLLLLLCACGEGASETITAPSTTEATVPYEPLELDLSVTMVDGHVTGGSSDMAMFAQQTGGGSYPLPSTEASITIFHSHDGTTYTSVLSYADGVYTISDEERSRSYPYLVYSSENLREGASSDFAEYYLLSEDPEMTSQRYFEYMLSSVLQLDFPRTEIVYMDFLSFDRAERYGTAPAKYANTENLSLLAYAKFCREGFYIERLLTEPDPAAYGLAETVRKCYTYDFKPLADDSLPQAQGAGVYQERAVDFDDPIFDPTEADRLPEEVADTSSYWTPFNRIWQEGENYILLRYHPLEAWKLQSGLSSNPIYYCELILTCYDQNGNPLWQAVSDIFVR